jgi:lantibiotic modifying enzyme
MKNHITLFPKYSEWSRSKKTGLMHGWDGWAWTWLRLRKANLIEDEGGHTLDRMVARMVNDLDHIDTDLVSHLNGYGIIPVNFALISTLSHSHRKHLKKSIRIWKRLCESSDRYDIISGLSGALVACSEVESEIPGQFPVSFLRKITHEVENHVSHLLKIGNDISLGYGHGYAGFILALEIAKNTFGIRTDPDLLERINDELWNHAIPVEGHGTIWPKKTGAAFESYHGLCNGTPGVTLCLLGAHLVSGKKSYLEKMNSSLAGSKLNLCTNDFFCCGRIGQSQVLIEVEKRLGLRVGKKIIGNKRLKLTNKNFYFGTLGEIYLKRRLEHPDRLPMPGFVFSGKAGCNR